MSAGTNEIIVGSISRGRSARENTGSGDATEPESLDGASVGSQKDIVVNGDELDGILKINVASDVDARIAIEDVVINYSIGDDPAVLSPHVQAVVMVSIGGGVPFHVI